MRVHSVLHRPGTQLDALQSAATQTGKYRHSVPRQTVDGRMHMESRVAQLCQAPEPSRSTLNCPLILWEGVLPLEKRSRESCSSRNLGGEMKQMNVEQNLFLIKPDTNI